MADRLAPFWTAVSFLTRLPTPVSRQAIDPVVLRQSIVFYPLVGTLIGLLTGVVAVTVDAVTAISIAVLLALGFEALLTGAFHEDAVADFFDAFGGGWTRQRILEILKDSRIGSFGTVALVLVISLRAAGMMQLTGMYLLVSCLGAGTLGRLMILLAMRLLPPLADRPGLSNIAGRHLCNARLGYGALAGLPGVLLWSVCMPITALLAGVLAILITGLIVHTVRYKIGGMTGDCLGCICYLSQLAGILSAAVCAGSSG